MVLTALAVMMMRPSLHFAESKMQARLGAPFEKALENLLDINTVGFDTKQYNSTGLMKGKVFIRAGGGYEQPWTRDAAINSWNAGSLFCPEVAADTLWAVTVPDGEKRPIVQNDNQWWDKVIWIVGAWNHYLVTGDRDFLAKAYGVAERLLAQMRRERFNAKFGLFEGPSFFNDGIAGYPAPPADPEGKGSSFVLDHEGTDKIMALSTNCLYAGAYDAAAAMARELGKPSAAFTGPAGALRKKINERFWIPATGLYGYFLHPDGSLDRSQEGSGLAFAVLFGVADARRAKSVMAKTHIEPFGITDVYPHFARFSDERPGRHNAIVWPMVQGMWARAAVAVGDRGRFVSELENLARLSSGSEGRFFEIYNAKTGKVDGGWQNGRQWGSVHDQTWSATAYLSMITNGVFGMRFRPNGLYFEPISGFDASLEGLRYQGAVLDISLRSAGSGVLVDGKRVSFVPAGLTGRHRVEVAPASRR